MPAMNRITDALATDVAAKPADGELLSRFHAGRDDPAFAELVARHGPMVYGVCLRRLGQCQDAEDCFQAVFLALATHGPKLTDRRTVGPWLYTVARQASSKALRSRSRRRWVFWGSTPEPAAKPPREVDVELDAALARLSEPERSAVVLCHLEGLSRSEAAKVLAIPEGTLSARLSRALEKLRRKLGRPPLAVLAAATVVILPDSLPASTVGLVHHLRAGALEDWASPRVLDLYRKALPMRLLDRFGPAFAALAAAILIMFGAAAGWQLVKGRPPGEGRQTQARTDQDVDKRQKKSLAKAVEEMQTATAPSLAPPRVQLKIGPPMEGLKQQPKDFPWSIAVLEEVAGARVFHTPQSWLAIEPLLKQIASGGAKQIEVALDPDIVGRLEANQVVNICKRAGFSTLDYRGPRLFVGEKDDPGKSLAKDAFQSVLHVDLSHAAGDLADWTNGWWSDGFSIHFQTTESQPGFSDSRLKSLGGVRGPAAELLAKSFRHIAKGDVPPSSDLAKQLETVQRALGGVGATAQITGDLGRAYLMLHQVFGAGDVVSFVDVGPGSDLLMARAAVLSKEKIDVIVGEDPQSAKELLWINPLQVNRVLNACKRGGLRRVHYFGQKLFTGDKAPTPYVHGNPIRNKTLIVRLTLDFGDFEGELPDDHNGWVLVQAPPKIGEPTTYWALKSDDREKFLESLRPKDEAPTFDAEIARLAKLQPDEFEKEIAKKPRLLQNRFRKAVEEAKTKGAKPLSMIAPSSLGRIEEEIHQIDEELSYWNWRLKPAQFDRSAQVQNLSVRREKLEQLRSDVNGHATQKL